MTLFSNLIYIHSFSRICILHKTNEPNIKYVSLDKNLHFLILVVFFLPRKPTCFSSDFMVVSLKYFGKEKSFQFVIT